MTTPETPAADALPADLESALKELVVLRTQVKQCNQIIQTQDARLAWLNRMVFGQKSEKRKPVQDPAVAGVQENFLQAPVVAVATVEQAPADAGAAVADADADTAQAATTDQQRRNQRKGQGPGGGKKKDVNGGGRRPVNPALRTVERVIAAPESERTAADGTALVLLGYEVSEREEYLPAELIRLVTKREIWGLPDTREAVVTAPVPPSIVPKGKYGDALIAEAMLRKYTLGLPFTRMLPDFTSLGSDLSDAQLSDLGERFARYLSPIADAIRHQVLARPFVHVDETPLPTLDGRRTIWAWVGGTQCFFHVGGRGGKELRRVLGIHEDPAPPPGPTAARSATDDDPGPAATLGWCFTHWMADAFPAYDGVAERAGITRLCCWSHGRRNFLPPEQGGDPIARGILDHIKVLYRCEADATETIAHAGLLAPEADAERLRRRQAHAVPTLERIHAELTAAQPRYESRHPMRQAIDYLLVRWQSFTTYTTRGDLPIDNNQAERVLRPIVIGRKNWLFIGSEDATAWAATSFTLFESCRLAKVSPRPWLGHVIARLHAGDTDYANLTPAACAHRFPAKPIT